jgi:hypothetical protein
MTAEKCDRSESRIAAEAVTEEEEVLPKAVTVAEGVTDNKKWRDYKGCDRARNGSTTRVVTD